MHLDGLADTADGLGCFGPPERALAVMRDGGAGPFAVVTLVLVVGVQAAALAELVVAGPAAVPAVALAAATGRAGFGWVCRRGVPAARPDGLGASVAGSQPWWVPVPGGRCCWPPVSGSPVPVRGAAVGLGALVTVALARHAAHRFGGMTGDVLGAVGELATTAALVILGTGPDPVR